MVEGTNCSVFICYTYFTNEYTSSSRYFAGNAGAYDGADLFRLSKQRVITVMLQHRLGFFGELSLV